MWGEVSSAPTSRPPPTCRPHPGGLPDGAAVFRNNSIFKCLARVHPRQGGRWARRRPWLKDAGRQCSGLSRRRHRAAPSGVTNCAGLSPPAPGVHPIKCHVLAAWPPSSKNCFKVLWRKKIHHRLETIQSGGRSTFNPPLLRPGPQAIVRSNFCGGADTL